MANVEFQSISKTFDQQNILKSVDLKIKSGEFLVLVGPSGCGKSTLLRLLAGLEQPTSGEILIDGRNVKGVQPKDRGLAMVFQSYALYPHLTVKENLGFALTLNKTPAHEMEKKIQEVAEILRLTKLLSRKPGQLSGGQRQRVALGRSLVKNPKIILFDEPLSNLDAALRSRMRYEIKKIHQKTKSTMIYVTHDQTEATTLGDRIAILNSGKIIQLGTAQEIFNKPVNKFVAGFVGSPEMNILPAEFLGHKNIDFGIRPDDIQIGDGTAQASFELEEYMGSHYMIYARFQGQLLRITRSQSVSKKTGDLIPLNFNMAKAHFFDRVSELRTNS